MNIQDYKYKIELHAHTSPVSGCSSIKPERMVEIIKELGCDAVVITNHCRTGSDKNFAEHYLNDYRRTKEAGEKCGVNVILGMELYASGDDRLVYGIDEEFVKNTVEMPEESYREIYKKLKNDKNFFAIAHPFRGSWRDLEDDCIDAVEVFNLHPGHNSKVGLAARYAKTHDIKRVICGSDLHDEPHQGMALLRTKTLPKDSFELAQILKSGDYLFDISGNIVIPYNFQGEL